MLALRALEGQTLEPRRLARLVVVRALKALEERPLVIQPVATLVPQVLMGPEALPLEMAVVLAL